MTAPRTVDIDLRRDLVEIYRAELDRLGYDARGISGDADLLRAYFGVCRRLVFPQPRQILKSKSFSCCPKYHDGLAQIEQIVREGGDLTPYLSKKIRDLEYNDGMLNDWGIHHLHLGERVKQDGFVCRTRPLLHCRFEEGYAYFIDVLPHGSWTKQKLIQTMHENWPDMMAQYLASGVSGDKLTDEQISILRKKHLNYCVEVESGIAYLPIGGGANTSGTNILDVARANRFLDWAQRMEKKIINDFPEIETRASERGIRFATPAVFRMRVSPEMFWAVETESNYALPLENP